MIKEKKGDMGSDGLDRGREERGRVLEAPAKPELKRPPLYKVLLLNDDFTPMDFVVDVLVNFFGMNQERATRVMFEVHTDGRGLCGTYTHDIAETKMAWVNDYAREHDHPLLCRMEPE